MNGGILMCRLQFLLFTSAEKSSFFSVLVHYLYCEKGEKEWGENKQQIKLYERKEIFNSWQVKDL